MGKTALLFPGQGAQFVGMGKVLTEEFAPARKLFEQAGEILGYDLAKICFEGPADELDSTVISQPAIFTLSIAAAEFLRTKTPEAVEQCGAAAGLSLGEYSALCFAGAFFFEDGLRLVQKRGQAMQDASDATPSGMVSIIGAELAEVEKLCSENRGYGVLQVANMLCPGNTAVSGTVKCCEKLAELSAAGAIHAVPLSVAGAFHTPLMKPADEILEAALAETPITTPGIPVISNVDALPHGEPDDIRKTLVKQVVSPVLWEKSIRSLLEQG
ncbi:MAG: acyltransferase domain-containing protein, partial [Planctomycetaceae bacterium]|nr:acyltransferase domain-containing protein [Planctomycetaceae bacterium]